VPEPEPVALQRRLSRRLGEALERARRRREVGVARPEVDHVHAPPDELPLLRRMRASRYSGSVLKRAEVWGTEGG
jgi:hypothetical protein